ncbi:MULTISPECIES: helix-turn-helix transcriptional regulator [unclassified Micromonospora]|uniref:helix-turn-helix domain-containing protein n=1 Tax=unclassified Micromonospora TaxID=2617518 RepID=UPI00259C6B96|nr:MULTISPECIES: helix-turn-helix transcriptional regulator [unclassified Micromonospora]MDM4778716.1 helix-turn-helix transcriptional regulator [Micromonospora sp. b486]MDM4783331.1 helix-turn-helix transcriptional regulator [Micromonospora sp. b486]
MTAKLDYRWRLREVMAERGMFSTTDLRGPLTERGIDLSASQVYRLVVEKPERLSLRTLMALLDILGCQMTDLIVPFAAAGSGRARKATAGDGAPAGGRGAEAGVGELRPRRARITPTQP